MFLYAVYKKRSFRPQNLEAQLSRAVCTLSKTTLSTLASPISSHVFHAKDVESLTTY